MPSAPVTPDTRILVVDLRTGDCDLIVGLQVERVFEVVQFDAGSLQSPPDIGGGWRSDTSRPSGG